MIESVERKTLAGSCSSRSVNRALEATLRCGADLFRLLFPGAGALAVIWVAKQARLFEKHGLDVAPVLIPSSVRTLQRSLPAKAPSLKAQVRPRLARAFAGGDIVALAGSVNIHLLFRHAAEH